MIAKYLKYVVDQYLHTLFNINSCYYMIDVNYEICHMRNFMHSENNGISAIMSDFKFDLFEIL